MTRWRITRALIPLPRCPWRARRAIATAPSAQSSGRRFQAAATRARLRPPAGCSPAAASPPLAGARDTSGARGLRPAAPRRQSAAERAAGVAVCVGVGGGKIAPTKPPQHAMDVAARPRRDRTEALGIDDEAPARKHRDADRLGAPA